MPAKLTRLGKLSLVFIFSFIFCTGGLPNAIAERNTPFTIVAGGGANLNFHSADFLNLTGMNRCCDNFQSGFGLGANLFAGMEYKLNQSVFNFPVSASFLFGYSNLYGKLKLNEFIGNVIQGNSYVRGESENTVEPKIASYYIEPSFVFSPIKGQPINFKLGLSAAFHSQIEFVSQESLISPVNGTYENGQRVRAVVSSTQANSSGVLLGAVVGARYEIYRSNGFSVSPELQYNFPLNNFSSDVKWTAHTLRAGVSLGYTIPQISPEPPQQAPVPQLPQPPKPAEKPIAAITLLADGTRVRIGDNIAITEYSTQYYNDYSINPIVFFKPNTTDELNVSFTPNKQSEVFDSYITKLKSAEQKDKIKIIIGTTTGENTNIGARRLEYVLSRMEKAGIARDEVTHEIVETNPEKLRHAEMSDELCYARIVCGDGRELTNVAIEDVTKRRTEFKSPKLRIRMEPHSGEELVYSGELRIGSKRIAQISSKETEVTLTQPDCQEIANQPQVNAIAKVGYKNKLGESSSSDFVFTVRTDRQPPRVMHRFIEIDEYSVESRMYFLGFFDFDRSTFATTNAYALAEVRAALDKGQKVEIIPLHDKFGEPEHNAKLLANRAAAARRIIGDYDNLTIKNPKEGSFLFDNDTPLGRMLSRSVIVRIINK